ncbi:hypothetical protein KRMM14A1004_11540 [Krasilnikovia sp. MM14-A1004]
MPKVMSKRARQCATWVAGGVMAAVSLVATPGAAQAGPPAPNHGWTRYETINKSYYQNINNPGGPVASCTNAGSTCALAVTQSVSTTIATKLGYSQSGVAADLSFSLSRTVSAAATCNSPKLKSGQKYVAYRVGRQAMYQIKRTTADADGKQTVTTSGWLFSWEPYTGAHIDCYVVG